MTSRNRLFYALMATFTLVATIAIGEIGARIVKQFGPSTFPFRQFDPELGVSLIPNVEGVHRQCYNGYVHINSHGLRDRERTHTKAPGNYRIMVIGDSLIEAVHVKQEETATLVLEEKLNRNVCDGNCEVINFSIGGHWTLQYYLRYLRDARPFKGDLVIIAFSDNDLPFSTDIATQAGDRNIAGNRYQTPRLVRQDDGNFNIAYPDDMPNANIMLTVFQHSDLAYLLYKAYNRFVVSKPRSTTADMVPDWARFNPRYVFLDPENPIAARGWAETEFVLDKFIADVRADGAKVLIAHSGYDVGVNPWYPPVPSDVTFPKSFDPAYASTWFREYGRKNNVLTYDLGKDIKAYIDRHEMNAPYLSFSCDAHFNVEGQAVIADLLYEQVVKQVVDHNK